VQVPLGLDREVDQAVARQQREHVVEEADAGGDVGAAGAVEVEGQLDLGLAGLAAELCGARHRAPVRGWGDGGDSGTGTRRGQGTFASAALPSGRPACFNYR